jgi:hypothetical protein
MAKKRRDFVLETDEQRKERWAKQAKAVKTFARVCGIDAKKIKREREWTEKLAEMARRDY